MKQCSKCGVYVPHGRMAIHRKENCDPEGMKRVREIAKEASKDINKVLRTL